MASIVSSIDHQRWSSHHLSAIKRQYASASVEPFHLRFLYTVPSADPLRRIFDESAQELGLYTSPRPKPHDRR